MKTVWQFLNTWLAVTALLGGYEAMAPGASHVPNNGPIPCVVMLASLPLFALGTVFYSKRRWDRENAIMARRFSLRRPSWDRNPLNWWGDPLQSLFISTCVAGATGIGASLRRPAVGSAEFWMTGIWVCCAVGLLVGQVLVYRVFAQYITPGGR